MRVRLAMKSIGLVNVISVTRVIHDGDDDDDARLTSSQAASPRLRLLAFWYGYS